MRHLAAIARDAGLKALIAEVLPENAAMRKVFNKFGFKPAALRRQRHVPVEVLMAVVADLISEGIPH